MDTERDPSTPSLYRAYLIRIWQVGTSDTWRASAQSAESGSIVRFASLDALFAFLVAETRDRESEDDGDSPSRVE